MEDCTASTAVELNCSIAVKLSPYASDLGPMVDGEITHISHRNMVIEVTYPLVARKLLRLQADHSHFHEAFSLPVFVEQVARLSERRWKLRCVFTRPFRDDEFAEVLSGLFGPGRRP